MVLAEQTIFIAGPPDVVDEEQGIRDFADPEIQKKLIEQRDVLDGKKGSLLLAVSASDDGKLAEHKLDSLPVWDGMAAANERLYMSTTDGRIVCLGDK